MRRVFTYLSDSVGLAVVHERRSIRAESRISSQDLSGVFDGGIAPGIGASHEGGRGSDDSGGTHFVDIKILLIVFWVRRFWIEAGDLGKSERL